jgi:hypothetical protein
MRNLDAVGRNLDESRQRRRGSFESLAQTQFGPFKRAYGSRAVSELHD